MSCPYCNNTKAHASDCIIKPYAETISRLEGELEEAKESIASLRETASEYLDFGEKQQARAEAAEQKLAAYEGAVEVEGTMGKLGIGTIYIRTRDIEKLKGNEGQRVRVLVMKGE